MSGTGDMDRLLRLVEELSDAVSRRGDDGITAAELYARFMWRMPLSLFRRLETFLLGTGILVEVNSHGACYLVASPQTHIYFQSLN